VGTIPGIAQGDSFGVTPLYNTLVGCDDEKWQRVL